MALDPGQKPPSMAEICGRDDESLCMPHKNLDYSEPTGDQVKENDLLHVRVPMRARRRACDLP